MDTSKLCFGCFHPHTGSGPCPNCGFDVATAKHPFVALPIGTILNGRYLTGRVLGVGGFGVTYLAFDMTLEICVAVKEFLPSGIALRDSDRYTMTVTAPEEQAKFDSGATRFLEEARLLAKLRDVPNIVTVQDYFRENNTAYFVMEYIEGVDLMKYTQMRGGKLSFEETMQLILPIIDSLAHVHAHNLLHRDISPDNIVVMRNGSTRLLDFGAARLAVDTEKSKSIILKHGFAPEEQYRKHGNQGPWSDEYALAATMYLILTGVMPPDAIERVHEDSLVSPIQLGIQMPQNANDALMKALSVSASERFPDMSSFYEALTGRPAVRPVPVTSPLPTYSMNDNALPTAASSMTEGNMVQGKTVAMSQEDTPSSPNGQAAQNYMAAQNAPVQQQAQQKPQKVLSPSILEHTSAQNAQAGDAVPQFVPMNANGTGPSIQFAKVKKPSIWKKPLTYIIAACIALVGAGVPTGIYLYNRYASEDVEESTRRTSKTTKETTEETEAPSEYADPSIQDGDGKKTYSDPTRTFSVEIPNTYKFENKNGLYSYVREDQQCAVYVDFLSHYESSRLETLNDCAALYDGAIKDYVEKTLGYEDFELKKDGLSFIDLTSAYAIMMDGNASNSDGEYDVTMIIRESRERPGAYFACGVMSVGEFGKYSSDNWDEIRTILSSFHEDSKKESGYVLYESEEAPTYKFLYNKKTITGTKPGTTANRLNCVNLTLASGDAKKNNLRVVELGEQKSMLDACAQAEQTLGYASGGYKAVTPTLDTEADVRIRNYSVSQDGTSLNCSACIMNLNGKYYAVIAVCEDALLQQMTLDYTLVVMSMLDN